MLKVSKAKLEAYEKALHAENNCVMLYMVGNRKQFDVYGTYYVKRKVNCARGVKVYKDVKTVGWHKVSQKEVAEILENYGLTVDEFVAIANGEYEEETAEVENVTTNEEVTAEDDGSNDDDYDEDEIVTVDNTDNYEDDEDELVDLPESEEKTLYEYGMTSDRPLFCLLPKGYLYLFKGNLHIRRIGYFHYTFCYETPLTDDVINNLDLVDITAQKNALEARKYTANKVTAEVKEETEMQEIKVQEASATTDTVKFEVGKIYYPCVRSENPKIKITKRTAKTVHYKVERYTGEFDCETRANIKIWDGVEQFYSGYTSASYYANDAVETATETVEPENAVNEEDSATVKAAKEELIYVNNQIKGVQRNIEYYVEQIKEYIGCIAKCENFISNYGVNLYDLQNKAAALENEIANRKIVDAIDDIGGSADAVDASVAAMIELNVANFTTANLLDAVNAADKAVENIPVKFELQNFASDVVIAGGYATIDTSVSGTVIPVIDEDAEIKNQLAEIAKLTNREKELEQQIAALQEELNAVQREYVKKDWNLTKYAKDLMDAVYQTVKTAFEKRTECGCIEINGVMMQSWHWDEYNAVRTKFDDSGFALWFYDDTVPHEYQYTEFVKYSTFKQFKAAISKLVAAIERGDKIFAFPADIPPIAEVADSDTETQKAI